MISTNPHQDCALHHAGAPLDRARRVVVAAHGRFGVAGDILRHAEKVNVPNVAWVAPQAADRSWWRNTFLAPLADNEPGLTSALDRFSAILEDLAGQGFGPDRIVLTGFSQGACLILEHVARYPTQWCGVVAMSGGLIGTGESDEGPCDTLNGHCPKRFDYPGRLGGVPIHLGCHSEDPVIPVARVRLSKRILGTMGAQVTLSEEPGRVHSVLPHDIRALRAMLEQE